MDLEDTLDQFLKKKYSMSKRGVTLTLKRNQTWEWDVEAQVVLARKLIQIHQLTHEDLDMSEIDYKVWTCLKDFVDLSTTEKLNLLMKESGNDEFYVSVV